MWMNCAYKERDNEKILEMNRTEENLHQPSKRGKIPFSVYF